MKLFRRNYDYAHPHSQVSLVSRPCQEAFCLVGLPSMLFRDPSPASLTHGEEGHEGARGQTSHYKLHPGSAYEATPLGSLGRISCPQDLGDFKVSRVVDHGAR